MIDDRTSNLNLEKPNQNNTLQEDVGRLRSAFDAIDSAIAGKQSALGFTPENAANKGAADGYASLDSGGKVPAGQLPSYVDDVLEYANLAAFPETGESGKMYVAQDTGRLYRWSGSIYVWISPSPGSTDDVPEGSTNKYFTDARARSAQLPATASTPGVVKIGSGLSVGADGTLSAIDVVTYEDSAAVLLEDGVASAGARNTAARGDHRHPTDTSRAAGVHSHAIDGVTGLQTALDGKPSVATTAQAQAGTDDTAAITPKKLRDALLGANTSRAASGYQKLPGGLIIQWGVTNSASAGYSVSATFAIAFPEACLQATMSAGTPGANVYVDGVTFTATTISGRVDGNGTSIARYIAIGH